MISVNLHRGNGFGLGCLLFLLLATGHFFAKEQSLQMAADFGTRHSKERMVTNIVRYVQQPVDLYWGASFGTPFYDTYYNNYNFFPYGGYNYPYNYGIFFGW
jgi:hypothetical protein